MTNKQSWGDNWEEEFERWYYDNKIEIPEWKYQNIIRKIRRVLSNRISTSTEPRKNTVKKYHIYASILGYSNSYIVI